MNPHIQPRPRLTHIEVKRLRNELGMTQVAFAEALGVSRRTVEAWEAEHSNAPPWYLTLAVRALKEGGALDRLKDIGDWAHDRSTGPAIPDDLWEVRRMAYDL